MNTAALANEFAKMRRLRVGTLSLLFLIAVVGAALGLSLGELGSGPDSPRAWNSLFNSTGAALMITSPLLLAVLASRQVDIEHQGSGWLLSATAGVASGALCRVKLLALGTVVGAVTVGAGLAVLGVGMLSGLTAPPLGRWAGFLLALTVVGLCILALHIVLAARVENQLVGVGTGLLGTVLALFGAEVPAWTAHLVPWGYYTLSRAAEYQDGILVALAPSYASVAGLGAVTAGLFALATSLFDRQEV